MWDGSDKLRLTMPDGVVYVYQGYVGAVVTAGAQLNLSQIVERERSIDQEPGSSELRRDKWRRGGGRFRSV